MRAESERKLDQKIEDALIAGTETLHISQEVKYKIDARLRGEKACQGSGKKEREVYSMKYWNPKKIVILTAAICLAVSTACVAAVKYRSSIAVSPANAQIKTYAQLEEKAGELGMEGCLPESFQNGYTFREGDVVESWNEQEDGGKGEAWRELNAIYEKEGMPDISVSAKKTPPEGAKDATGEVKTTLYKIVPEDYKITPEEQKAMEEGTLMISCDGSDQIREQTLKSVNLESGGFQYIIITWDTPLKDSELSQMTEEIRNP